MREMHTDKRYKTADGIRAWSLWMAQAPRNGPFDCQTTARTKSCARRSEGRASSTSPKWLGFWVSGFSRLFFFLLSFPFFLRAFLLFRKKNGSTKQATGHLSLFVDI